MSEKIIVWDRFVRVFHWSLVGLFIVSYLSGENEHWIHSYSGYAITALIAMRLLWGAMGSQYARFKQFIYKPSTIIDYGKAVLAGKPKRYLGHNPLGGLMVLVMLVTLSAITLSGMKLYAVEEGKGPFSAEVNVSLVNTAYADSDEHGHKRDHDEQYENRNNQYGSEKQGAKEQEEFWEDIHEGAISFMILLILLHIGGVVLSSRMHNESLVKAMVDGKKQNSI